MSRIKNPLVLLCLLTAMGISANALSAEKDKKSKIPDGGVTTEKLADGAVTIVKLSADIVARLDQIDALTQRIAALEQRVREQNEAMQVMLGCIHPDSNSLDLVFEGCNVHIRNLTGASDSADTFGNLIIGYNESLGSGSRIGSHNLVIGPGHGYAGTSGIVAGNDSARLEVMAGEALVSADDVVVESENDTTFISEFGNVEIESRRGNVTLESRLGTVNTRATQSIELKVGATSVKLDSLKISAKGTQATVDATTLLKLRGGGFTSVEGSIVKINSGGRPVARVGDRITGSAGPYAIDAIIAPPGSATVFVP